MDYETIKIAEYRGRIDAIMSRVEAMKVHNIERHSREEAPAYHADCFFAAEQEIEGWANSIMIHAENLGELTAIVKQLESCGYEGEGGSLVNNTSFVKLKNIAEIGKEYGV